MSSITFDKEWLIFNCPHCDEGIVVKKNEINCTIFRHGVFKSNNQQMGPHTKKEECERLIKEKLIYGCGKPFKIVNGKRIEICGYI